MIFLFLIAKNMRMRFKLRYYYWYYDIVIRMYQSVVFFAVRPFSMTLPQGKNEVLGMTQLEWLSLAYTCLIYFLPTVPFLYNSEVSFNKKKRIMILIILIYNADLILFGRSCLRPIFKTTWNYKANQDKIDMGNFILRGARTYARQW